MAKEVALQRSSHKLMLIILKYIPIITALCYILNTIFAAFGIDTPILSHISGMSLLPWLFILVATYVFRFCVYHRMFLYYILVSDTINIIDYYIGIPLSTYHIIILLFCIIGLFLFLILYTHVKHNKETVRANT